MRVFLSHAQADKLLAARLGKSLEAQGLKVSALEEPPATDRSEWRQRTEDAIRSAEAVLLLINPRGRVDEAQDLTWRLALEAAWSEPGKRLLPLLLGDAILPAFVRSGSEASEVQAIRVRDPQNLDQITASVLQVLGVRDATRSRGVARDVICDHGIKPGYGVPPESFDVIAETAHSDAVETYPTHTAEDRARRLERLSEIREYAESLKH